MVNEMFDSRKNTDGCGTDAAAYLYGELGPAEQKNFEEHLANCDSCTEDLAAFSMIRLSIGELRQESVPKTAVEEPGLLDRLRDLFAGFPLGVRAVSGALAAAILIFAAFFAYSLIAYKSSDSQVAGGPSGTDIETRSNPGSDPIPAKDLETPEKQVPGTTDDLVENEDGVAPQAGPGTEEYASKPSRRIPDQRARKPRAVPVNQLAENNEPPRLSEAATEDTDDDSLRLTDLFAETGKDD